ncbi:M4 family metallopeptidase [Streptomyces decoyicus]|uniref:M4 family metallopeptidase n=1 Tax=Streptomyces decoyicus TaxID=249567 RepID=UPI0033FFA82A
MALQAYAEATFRPCRAESPSLVAPAARAAEAHLDRTIFDTHHSLGLPGDVVGPDGAAPTADGTVNRAYDGISHDIVAHELTHAVAQFTAGSAYQDQSGALNESVSDVFGSLIKQFDRRRTAEQADWPISAEVRLAARGLPTVRHEQRAAQSN